MTKYEIYVPLKYNDGTEIEVEKKDFKEQLKDSLHQLDILITAEDIRTI